MLRLYRVDAGSRFRGDQWYVVYQVGVSFVNALDGACARVAGMAAIRSALERGAGVAQTPARFFASGRRKEIDPYCIKVPCARCMGRFGPATQQCADSLYMIDDEHYISVLEIQMDGWRLEPVHEESPNRGPRSPTP
jgi:hypothetical protein